MICEHCQHRCQITIELASPNGKPWHLCARCWIDGAFKKVTPTPEERAAAMAGKPAGRSLATGQEFTFTGEPPDPAPKKPRAPRKKKGDDGHPNEPGKP